ncbi:MAG: hypothetical protein ACRC3B_17545 [Bacteroidia bacterium]
MVEKMEAEAELLVGRAFEYITVLNNAFVACMNLKKSGTEKFIEKATHFYKSIPTRKITERINETYINLLNNQISFLLKKRKDKLAYDQCHPIMKMIIQQNYRFSNSIVAIFFTNYTVASLYNGKFREARKYHNTLRGYLTQFDTQVELLGLIIYYELREYDLLLYRVRSFRKQLKRKTPSDSFADAIAVTLASPQLHRASRGNRSAIFQKLQESLAAPVIRKNSPLINGTFDFDAWIDAQAKRMSVRKTQDAE